MQNKFRIRRANHLNCDLRVRVLKKSMSFNKEHARIHLMNCLDPIEVVDGEFVNQFGHKIKLDIETMRNVREVLRDIKDYIREVDYFDSKDYIREVSSPELDDMMEELGLPDTPESYHSDCAKSDEIEIHSSPHSDRLEVPVEDSDVIMAGNVTMRLYNSFKNYLNSVLIKYSEVDERPTFPKITYRLLFKYFGMGETFSKWWDSDYGLRTRCKSCTSRFINTRV